MGDNTRRIVAMPPEVGGAAMFGGANVQSIQGGFFNAIQGGATFNMYNQTLPGRTPDGERFLHGCFTLECI